jgi:ABC-type branched-subunit amino acid transport system substrate-binding protein
MAIARGVFVAAALVGMSIHASAAEKKYGPGVTDSEIKIGQTLPYSGPASAYSKVGVAQTAYFRMVNENGAINGRNINLISLDDGYSSPKTVEQVRKLVESDEVFLMYQTMGTPSNIAIQKYLNQRKIPQLFVATGASRFNDPANFPFTTGWGLNYASEARVYADYILRNMPNAKIAILAQNDDMGRDYSGGFKEGLGAQANKLIVGEASFYASDPTIDSQIVMLKDSGADVLVNFATAKAAAQAIRRMHELNWHPVHFLTNASASVGAVFKPAGLEASKGIISAAYQKDPNDPQWKDDPAVKDWNAWMDRYLPNGDKSDFLNVYGYSTAQTLVEVLKLCGDDLTRENVMKNVTSLNIALPMLLPGIRLSMSSTDLRPIKQARLQKFNGERWELFGGVIDIAQMSPVKDK